MRRDLDVIRDLLLEIEQFTGYTNYSKRMVNDTRDFNMTAFHLMILVDNGFIEATMTTPPTKKRGPEYIISRITSSGCDYLDNIRDKSIWDKTKTKLGSLGETASLEVVKITSGAIIKEALKIIGD